MICWNWGYKGCLSLCQDVWVEYIKCCLNIYICIEIINTFVDNVHDIECSGIHACCIVTIMNVANIFSVNSLSVTDTIQVLC